MIGADTAEGFLKRVFSKLLSNLLAQGFSWHGLKQKKVFSKTELQSLL